ncbi:MAG: hypothetical protein RR319_01250 [Bacteroides sp.]
MKAATLENRISEKLTTKAGKLIMHYEKVVDLLKNPKTVVHPCRWNRNGSHFTLQSKMHQYIYALSALGIDYELGNDAPNGGQEGNFIKLSKKGLRQVADFAKNNALNWIAYKQGSGWVINDGHEVSQLHYSIRTKGDVLKFISSKSSDLGTNIKTTFA